MGAVSNPHVGSLAGSRNWTRPGCREEEPGRSLAVAYGAAMRNFSDCGLK